MRIRLGIVDARAAIVPTEPMVEVLVEAPAGTVFGDLRPHLARHLTGPGDDRLAYDVDGSLVADDAPLGEGDLVRGAVLTVRHAGSRSPARMPPGRVALLELAIVGGPASGRTFPLARGEQVVGRAVHCGIRLDDLGVSRVHSVLSVSDSGVSVRDLEPTNPSLVDGIPVPGAGLGLDVGARLRLGSTTLVLRRPEAPSGAVAPSAGVVRFHRPPRFVRAPTANSVEFPRVPSRPEGQRLPLLASIAPLVLSTALAVALRSPIMLLFALMSPVLLVGQWWSDRRHGRRSYRRLVAAHRQQVEAATAAVERAVAAERGVRHDEHPDLAVVGQLARCRDGRLWERRPDDADHLVVRLGTADQPSRVQLSGDHPPGAVLCPDVPALCSFVTAGVIGIAGARETALSLTGGVLTQLCTWHSPRFLSLVLLTDSPTPEADWGWATRLPHLSLGETSIAAVADTSDEAAVARRVAELLTLVEERRGPGSDVPPARSVVLVLDGAQALRSVPGIATLLRDGPAAGLHVLCVDSDRDRLPAETATVVELVPGPRVRATVTDADGILGDVVPDLPSPSWLERMSRHLAPMVDATPEPSAGSLPTSVGFREAHLARGVDPTSPEALVLAWSSTEGSARATLGVTQEGPFTVDLGRDGPHTLVGGTTGAGKSELLQTLVAGLAVSNCPDQLAFVLIDYKGGSAFRECARLPHTLGVVTDLDHGLTTRALTSLDAELKRRERLLALAGAKDLDDYASITTRDRRDLPGIPRLVLVVDEFKLLADELPDFVAGLVRIAAVGRSLGIHLVLATQRPAGIITGDMRANISLRVALRVRDRSDSDDVIEGPEAASISDRMPGRAWVRTAGQRLVEVQTAYAGAPVTDPAGETAPRQSGAAVRVWRTGFRGLARPWPVPEDATERSLGRTQLAAFVDAARAAADLLSIEPGASPWLPPLPTDVSLDALPTDPRCARRGDTAYGSGPDGVSAEPRGARLGLVDLPHEQRQDVLRWDPMTDGHVGIAGGPRSGRSSTLTALALELAMQWSPADLHVHVLAGSGSPLGWLRDLPHVGSVVGADDPLPARRLVVRLLDEAAAHSRSGGTAASGATPLVVLLVDGWESLEDAFDEVEHGAPTEELLRLARDGLATGVRVVVTGGRGLVSGRLAGLLQRRLVLPMPDPLDMTLAGLDPDVAAGRRPPGRAIDLHTGAEVQLAHAGPNPSPAAQREAIASVAAMVRARHRDVAPSRLPWHVRPLPETVTLDEGEPTPGLLRLGVGGDDARTFGLDLATAPPALLVVGPSRSGRSTALTLIANQLASAGRPLAVITTRRSPLTELGGIPGVTLLRPSETERFIELRRASPELGIVVDDAEDLDGTAIEPALLEAVRLLDSSGGYCAVAVDVHRVSAIYRGLVVEVARHQTGLVLCPTSPSDGELLRTRVEVPRHRLPGRGVAIINGTTTPVQVALPSSQRVSSSR
ncbi:hypothetical protein N865_17535 [Intrasporangium oryzae NRRL B-24470]|uniref:Cell division protein FtsK n=1 Tax=Intrasporangium oryzae NRRL B-24470 TaxID=1386089 RepID=W9G4I1_9MICO|nr:FtsK/SpoIIIE domain-containing protein [Intrasporangium oryzae]EWT00217.1 hypothetical protein N865_17535 [Intrasporangium oryzae NRRL B-24470]